MDPKTIDKLNIVKSLYKVDGFQFAIDVERDYRKLIEEKDFLKHPVFKGIVSDIENQINSLNAILLNDETLTDSQRDKIFAQRRALKIIMKSLSVEVKDEAIKALDELIDSKCK